MSISASDSAWLCRQFDVTDMDALNARAAMLQRLDNKYIVDAEVLEQALPVLTRHFDMLEIGGLRAFSYENCYFDGPLLQSYFDHHQGRRKRSKVRMRKYTDTGLCFVEIKLKDKRGVTVKRRLPCDPMDFGSWSQAAQDHVNAAYRAMYQCDFPYALGRTIDTNYTRMTLVAKQGGERLTIDSRLHFLADGRSKVIGEHFFILETKSANGNGLADRILRRLHQHPVKHCSKYCTGLVFLRDGLKHNNFKSALRKFGRPANESTDTSLLTEQS
jgi:hypothetical protein